MGKKILACFAALVLLALSLTPIRAKAAENSYIRVLLSTNGTSAVTVQVNGYYSIPTRSDITLISGTDYTISCSGGSLLLSGGGMGSINIGSSFTIQQHANVTGTLSYLYVRDVSRSYLGDITFNANYGAVQLINRVHIEDYTIGVIRGEMGDSFPLDALRAQAVAARTYGYKSMKTTGTYDVTDTTDYQVYRGYSSKDVNCIKAVNDTAGIIVHYGSSAIYTYYGASNGGQVELILNRWPERASGPYSQMVDDPYDLRNPSSPVDSMLLNKSGSITNYSLDQLLRQRMGGYYGSILGIESITLSNPRMTAAGSQSSRYYLNITFNLVLPADGGYYDYNYIPSDPGIPTGDSSGGSFGGVVGLNSPTNITSYNSSYGGYTGTIKIQQVTLNTQSDLISLISPSRRCSLFTVVDMGTAFRIEARRFGHGVGMSQRGAQQMANEGIGYLQILSFYYPNTTLVTHDFARTETPYDPSANVPGDTTPTDNNTSSGIIGTGVITASSLVVRAQPTTASSQIGSLARNASVNLLGQSGEFYIINYNGMTGYISKLYVNATLNSTGTDNTDTNTSPETTPTNTTMTGIITLVSSANVNVRSGPSTSYSVAAQLKNGSSVTVTGTMGDWSSITSGTINGYIMSKYITVTGSYGSTGTTNNDLINSDSTPGGVVGLPTNTSSPTPIPTSTPTPPPYIGGSVGGVVGLPTVAPTATPTPVPTSTIDPSVFDAPTATPTSTPTPTPSAPQTASGTIKTSGGTVNMRSGPSTTSAVIAKLGNNVSVTVQAKNGDWYRVTTQGITGYVSAPYITVTGTVADENTPATTETSTGNKGTYYIKLSNINGSLNLRPGPNTDGSPIATLKHGAVVTATGVVSGEWTQIEHGGKTGYVKTIYLSSTIPTGTSTNNKTAKTTASVNLRSKASTASDSTILAVVPKDTQVIVLNTGSEFSQCTYNGKTGYISNKYLSS